jgi:DUF2075 family protein
MPNRAYYSDTIAGFVQATESEVLGRLAAAVPANIVVTQRDAWAAQIRVLASALSPYADRGKIYFEFSVPRLGKRIDVLLLIDHVLFVVEFKVGERVFSQADTDQVFDYALDLKNFHETTHEIPVAPVLIATEARPVAALLVAYTNHNDWLLQPIHASKEQIGSAIEAVLEHCEGPQIDVRAWEEGRYSPTPNVVEAATALYAGHSVAEISRSDAGAINLTRTSDRICEVIADAGQHSRKAICFVTGVPGAGKTLVGLNIATKHIDRESQLYSVFLSGNGPLVAILREALARDKVRRETEAGRRQRKGAAMSEVKLFVQNVHHFRDECLIDKERPPIEHVALFDEAQRAWDREQTVQFMRRKKGLVDFDASEPEFLIECMDRHKDWSVIVCLVGGGQEIHRGEAGIGEWIRALRRSFDHWDIYVSPRLHDSEFGAGSVIAELSERPNVKLVDDLHLGVSMRSFRAERVSELVKLILDQEEQAAAEVAKQVVSRFPIAITRDLASAKRWLKEKARGSERFGIVVSSHAQRLKPHAIDVRSPIDPVHWFLDGKEDVRSSYFMEDAATEFQVQGLELDWACVVWDADFRYRATGWECLSFMGSKWQRIHKDESRSYLKNAYRVLLTRARQGMVIVVPRGSAEDPSRDPSFYDRTFRYLSRIGFSEI